MTDQELETLIDKLQRLNRDIGILVDLEDYLDQIALMATIVSHYGHQHPDTDGVQVRMIARIAEQGSKMLKQAEENIERNIHYCKKMAWDIQEERMRQQEKTAQCQHCTQYINLLQVIPSEVTT